MIKSLKISAIVLLTGVAMLFSSQTSKSNNSTFTEANISLMNEARALELPVPANTGPASTEDCAGWGTGSKKICASTNAYACTESGCS
jgi:small neutral amino acid transporter SnatA (MarC family)